MLFAAFAALSVAVVVVLVYPLIGRVAVADGAAQDVYANQLAELDADVARDAISPADADAARAEVSRRLLRAHKIAAPAVAVRRPRLATALAVVVFVPAFALGGYLVLGAPDYADQSLASLTEPDAPELAALAAEAAARVARDPKDGAALSGLAIIDLQRGEYDAAAKAFAAAGDALGERPELLAGRARALTFASGGTITDEALALFSRAAELAPDADLPQVFLAVAARQRGDLKDAARRWRSLMERSNGTEPWLAMAQSEVGELASASGGALPAAPPPPGGGGATDRQAMIESMVSGLAARLRDSGGSAEEWARLVRSYRVLGREDDAKQAAAEAMTKLPEADRAAFAAADGIADMVR